jgi:hypothetical protein
MSRFLDTLGPDQQRLVDLVAESFDIDEEWPIFDYVESTFDRAGDDAAKALASFPREQPPLR